MNLDITTGIGVAGLAWAFGMTPLISAGAGAAGAYVGGQATAVTQQVKYAIFAAGVGGAGAKVGGLSMNMKYLAIAGGGAAGYYYGNMNNSS